MLRNQRPADLDVLRRVRLTKDKALLDVGYGSDTFAAPLGKLGYNAKGINLQIFGDNSDGFGTTVKRKWFKSIDTDFDVILFRRSLERLPVEMLSLARQRIRDGGCCVACIAMLGWAWRTYGTDWVQLNAPRHRLIHSNKSFGLLAEKSGFRIDQVVFDSSELQFWLSDGLQRNLSLEEIPGPSRSQRARMRRLAETLNLQRQGDTAQFYLTPI